jgi:hypothetical protein
MKQAIYRLSLCVVIVLLVSGACAPVADDDTQGDTQDEEESREPQGGQTGNRPPQILRLETGSPRVSPQTETWVGCTVFDADGDALLYQWGATGGSFSTPPGSHMMWVAPDRTGDWTITLTVTDSAGNAASRSITVTVGENKPPAIASLAPLSPTVMAGHSTLLTCLAQDPEGQMLAYSWSADCGELTGEGPRVTWFAPTSFPGNAGECAVNVIVSDGEDGIAFAKVVIPVVFPGRTEEFTRLMAESGTVCTDGSKTNSRARAGDDDENQGYRAFWTYDLYRLRGAEVAEAKLEFTTGFVSASQPALDDNNPFNKPRGLGTLHVYQVRFDPGGLPIYDIAPMAELTDAGLWHPPTEIDVTAPVKRIAAGSATDTRLQVMAAFQRESNKNMFAEYITWDSVILRVSYTKA